MLLSSLIDQKQLFLSQIIHIQSHSLDIKKRHFLCSKLKYELKSHKITNANEHYTRIREYSCIRYKRIIEFRDYQ